MHHVYRFHIYRFTSSNFKFSIVWCLTHYCNIIDKTPVTEGWYLWNSPVWLLKYETLNKQHLVHKCKCHKMNNVISYITNPACHVQGVYHSYIYVTNLICIEVCVITLYTQCLATHCEIIYFCCHTIKWFLWHLSEWACTYIYEFQNYKHTNTSGSLCIYDIWFHGSIDLQNPHKKG